MKKHFNFILIAIFSIFLGSQITEAILLVPYWQSLSPGDFYGYYQKFGPSIGRFYTILTVIAASIPITFSIFYFRYKKPGLTLALASSLLAMLFVSCFYIYFKDTNELFYQSAFNENELINELIIWSKWHWGRIVLEGLSLLFLILALGKRN